jgi:hypothetical protein
MVIKKKGVKPPLKPPVDWLIYQAFNILAHSPMRGLDKNFFTFYILKNITILKITK